MNPRTREEEYMRRMKALGYEPDLRGMDDGDIEWELGKMDEANRRREAEWQQPVYRPVDPGLKARILRMFGQPHDKSAIPKGQEFYLNGWDNGEDEYRLQKKPAPGMSNPLSGGTRRPEEPLNYWDTALKRSNHGTGNWLQPMSETSGKDGDRNWWVDPKGMYPADFTQVQLPAQQPASETTTTPKHPQALWDEHVWNSPEVISAQTPHEKRTAVNKVIDERRGEFDAAYKAAYGDKADSRWSNDRTFTLNAMGDYVSADQLKAFGWQNVDDKMVKDLNDALVKYEITSPARIRHFLAQAAKESDMGQSTLEYGDDDYWNNNGYGRKFRGAGYIQMTWPEAYEKFAKEANDDDVLKKGSEYVAQKYPWQASAFWWHRLNHMNDLVDKFDGTDAYADVDRVTDVVNYYTDPKSRAERKEHYKKWLSIIPD